MKKIIVSFIFLFCIFSVEVQGIQNVALAEMKSSTMDASTTQDSANSTVDASTTQDSANSTVDASTTQDSTNSTADASTTQDSANSTADASTTQDSTNSTMDEDLPSLSVTSYALGSETNPYLVSTFSELQNAIRQTYNGTKYISLIADITVNTRNMMNIESDTVIDGLNKNSGDYYSIFYSGDVGTTNGIFGTGTSGLNITVKNINFGSENNAKNTWYGFVYVQHANTTLNIENINYYATIGSQPFFSNSNDCTLNISGNNSFYSSGSSYGGEFVEGFVSVNFKAGSNTVIESYSTVDNAIFYGTTNSNTVKVNLEDSSKVQILSGKNYLFWATSNNCSLNVGKNAEFYYTLVSGYSNATKSFQYLGYTLNMNFEENSIGEFVNDTSNVMYGLYRGSKINANSPDHILFSRNTAGTSTDTQRFLYGDSAYTIPFTRTDSSSDDYRIKYIDHGETTTNDFVYDVASLSTYSVTPTSPTSKNQSVIYEKVISINDNNSGAPESGLFAVGESGYDNVPYSQISSTIHGPDDASLSGDDSGYSPPKRQLYKVEYFLSTTKLSSNDDITSAYDEAIKNNSNYVFTEKILYNDDGSVNTDISHVFTNLPAGNYYLYARLTDKVLGIKSTDAYFNTISSWVLRKALVPESKVTVFSNNITFTAPSRNILQDDSVKTIIQNYSNVNINVRLDKVTKLDTSSSIIGLIPTLFGVTNDLNLMLTATSSENSISWQILTDNLDTTKSIKLNPYWEDGSVASLSLSGAFFGPFGQVNQVNYNLMFAIE